MSAAVAERAHLAAIGRDLMADESGRANALLHASAAGAAPARAWGDLAAVPDWLRLRAGARKHLAMRVALLAMAGALAQSIDGEWLGALAERAGEDALDWAIAQAGSDALAALPRIEADALESTGLAILAASLSPTLRGCLPPTAELQMSGEQARALVERAR